MEPPLPENCMVYCMSLYQTFVDVCLRLQAQNSTGIQGVFGADEQLVQPDRDVSHLPQVPAFNWPDSVDIPVTEHALDIDHSAELQQRVDPFGGCLGVDLLQDVIAFINSEL